MRVGSAGWQRGDRHCAWCRRSHSLCACMHLGTCTRGSCVHRCDHVCPHACACVCSVEKVVITVGSGFKSQLHPFICGQSHEALCLVLCSCTWSVIFASVGSCNRERLSRAATWRCPVHVSGSPTGVPGPRFPSGLAVPLQALSCLLLGRPCDAGRTGTLPRLPSCTKARASLRPGHPWQLLRSWGHQLAPGQDALRSGFQESLIKNPKAGTVASLTRALSALMAGFSQEPVVSRGHRHQCQVSVG